MAGVACGVSPCLRHAVGPAREVICHGLGQANGSPFTELHQGAPLYITLQHTDDTVTPDAPAEQSFLATGYGKGCSCWDSNGSALLAQPTDAQNSLVHSEGVVQQLHVGAGDPPDASI